MGSGRNGGVARAVELSEETEHWMTDGKVFHRVLGFTTFP